MSILFPSQKKDARFSNYKPSVDDNKVVDPLTRRIILLVICYASKNRPRYSDIMQRVKILQEKLQNKFDISLGYNFRDEHIYNVWDNTLLEDLKILTFENLLDNQNYRTKELGYPSIIYTHSLDKITEDGMSFLINPIKQQLEEFSKGLFQYIITEVENEDMGTIERG